MFTTSSPPTNRLLKLLRNSPPGIPLTSSALNAVGIGADSVYHYVKGGYLKRLGHGVVALPSDEITPWGAVKALQNDFPQLHVAARSALSLYGIVHNLYVSDEIILFGPNRMVLPKWAQTFKIRYRCDNLFDFSDDEGLQLNDKTLKACPLSPFRLTTSVPERAVIEMLYEAGTLQDYEEAENLFNSLINPRKRLFGQLLSRCRSKKAIRLFFKFAKRTTLLGFDPMELKTSFPIDSGTPFCWSIKANNRRVVLCP